MRCRDCSYGIESFEKYESYIDEEDFENCVWCDKVGGKVYSHGHCSDWYEKDEENYKSYSKKKKMNKRERYLKHQNYLKYLYEAVGGNYLSPVIYTDEIRVKNRYVKNPKPYYKRLYRRKSSSYLKKQSNKVIRKYEGNLHKGYRCHRLYDFWWEYC